MGCIRTCRKTASCSPRNSHKCPGENLRRFSTWTATNSVFEVHGRSNLFKRKNKYGNDRECNSSAAKTVEHPVGTRSSRSGVIRSGRDSVVTWYNASVQRRDCPQSDAAQYNEFARWSGQLLPTKFRTNTVNPFTHTGHLRAM